MFARALADRTRGTNVTCVSVHPGVIATNLWRFSAPILTAIVKLFVADKDIPQGAATTVYAAISPDILQDTYRGVYLSDCHIKRPSCECARDEDGRLSKALWNVMEKDIATVVSSWTK